MAIKTIIMRKVNAVDWYTQELRLAKRYAQPYGDTANLNLTA